MSDDFGFDEAEAEPIQSSALLVPIKAEVISINEDSTSDEMQLALGKVKNYLAELKMFQKLIEGVMIEHIKAHGNIEVSPTIFYTVGADKTTRLRDLKAAVEMLWEASGGDFNRFVGCLSSNVLKPGACKSVLTPKQFGEAFEVVVKEKLVEGGAKMKADKLVRVDRMFM